MKGERRKKENGPPSPFYFMISFLCLTVKQHQKDNLFSQWRISFLVMLFMFKIRKEYSIFQELKKAEWLRFMGQYFALLQLSGSCKEATQTVTNGNISRVFICQTISFTSHLLSEWDMKMSLLHYFCCQRQGWIQSPLKWQWTFYSFCLRNEYIGFDFICRELTLSHLQRTRKYAQKTFRFSPSDLKQKSI